MTEAVKSSGKRLSTMKHCMWRQSSRHAPSRKQQEQSLSQVIVKLSRVLHTRRIGSYCVLDCSCSFVVLFWTVSPRLEAAGQEPRSFT